MERKRQQINRVFIFFFFDIFITRQREGLKQCVLAACSLETNLYK